MSKDTVMVHERLAIVGVGEWQRLHSIATLRLSSRHWRSTPGQR